MRSFPRRHRHVSALSWLLPSVLLVLWQAFDHGHRAATPSPPWLPHPLYPCGWSRKQQQAQLTRAGLNGRGSSSLPRRTSQDDDAGEASDVTADWRDFRARLVAKELAGDSNEEESGQTEEDGWAYATPLLEQGSLLLSSPGDHFAINQQYFHKAVILIVEHDTSFTRGIILNRPSAFNTGDLTNLRLESSLPEELANSSNSWNVWHGGDCQGLNAREGGGAVYYCLHTLNRLANMSTQIIKGAFFIDLDLAQRLVAQGKADKNDFLLLVGYCGWSPGQLQGELDRGDTWTMAAADQRILLGKLRDEQAALTVRLEAAKTAAAGGLTATDLGDGIEDWGQLFCAVRRPRQAEGEEEEGPALPDDAHTDDMLRRWISRCLIPARLQAVPVGFPRSPAALGAAAASASNLSLSTGALLRGSATAWLLGKPAEKPIFEMMTPSQYLHKAVLMVVNPYTTGDGAVVLALLNGPKVHSGGGGNESQDVYVGGPFSPQVTPRAILEVGGSFRFLGVVILEGRVFEALLPLKALEVVEGVSLDEVLAVPPNERWEAAGGRMETLEEARVAKLGDKQRRKWYQRLMGVDVADSL